MEFLIVLFLVVIFIAGIIFFAGYIIWRIGPVGKSFVIVSSVLLVFSIYEAIFPFDGFYKREFVNVTGIAFPESGKIIKKFATYPDFHGDYSSCAIIQVSMADYVKLKEVLLKYDKKLNTRQIGFCKNDKAWKELGDTYELSVVQENLHNETREWGILKDSQWIYIDFFKW